MNLNKHASHKIESECKCYYDEIYIQNRSESRTIRIRITNHSDKKGDHEGYHNKAVIEVPYDIFVDLINQVSAK